MKRLQGCQNPDAQGICNLSEVVKGCQKVVKRLPGAHPPHVVRDLQKYLRELQKNMRELQKNMRELQKNMHKLQKNMRELRSNSLENLHLPSVSGNF